MQNFFTVALPLLAAVTTNTATLPFSSYKLQDPPPAVEVEKTAIREVAPEKPKEIRLICKGCSDHENMALDHFQALGIKDRNALATIMGNIKQESMFVPNICEGGARTSYHNCGRGYGLIQWTSSSRYYGLGEFARKFGGSPSSIETQLRYLVNEVQWKEIEDRMKTPGRSVYDYMNAAYRWIGWGIHGNRTHYAYEYLKKFDTIKVEVS